MNASKANRPCRFNDDWGKVSYVFSEASLAVTLKGYVVVVRGFRVADVSVGGGAAECRAMGKG